MSIVTRFNHFCRMALFTLKFSSYSLPKFSLRELFVQTCSCLSGTIAPMEYIYPFFTTSLRSNLVNKNSLSYGVHGNFYL